MASVATHLAKMLSTRAGSVQTLPDYGLPDLNDMRLSLHDSLQQARIAIEGLLRSEGCKRQVSFSASLAGSGQVKVN
jgi:type VI secretion system protein